MTRRLWRTLRGLLLLTGALLQRLTREGLVLRSLTFPTGLTVGTLVLTIGVVAWVRWDPLVAITADLEHLQPALVENGLRTAIVDDPQADVEAERAWAGTNGREIWLSGSGPKALILESMVRQELGADWRPDTDVPKPPLRVAIAMGRRVVMLLGVLFALYGVVFGAGMIARDRDAGILEIELSLPLPRWVVGASRLLAGTLSLSVFLALGILMVDAVIGIPNAWATIRHGIACACGSTCIGMLVIGRAGLKAGFTGPLTTGMSLATGLVAVGLTAPGFARWLPLASFASSASGWEALAGAAVLSIITLVVFTLRSATA
ncbi:MAG: ABC transporter permease subunit [Deltaproteobacteria bacterium]|nr:ABC transporter permease subunit [Deltaproteobacteria bacterium]MBW2253250.1 ABC transporter permease subunit [Deltaproteobacteria bacterium]